MTVAQLPDRPYIAIVGAGRWGLTLAALQLRAGRPTVVWSRNAEAGVGRLPVPYVPTAVYTGGTTATDTSRGDRRGTREEIVLSSDLGQVMSNCYLTILAIPSAALRQTVRLVAPFVRPQSPVVGATKGLEPRTGLRVSQVWDDEMDRWASDHPARNSLAERYTFVALSGPNLAVEIAQGLPAAAVVAGIDVDTVRFVRDTLATPRFRLYSSDDLIGVEMGGSLKNVLAIAAGISDGLGYGDNARAALLTRGLAEIARLGVATGAQERTFAGLSGLGDVLATCTSRLSRNYQLGWQIGKGHPIDEAMAAVEGVAEGVSTVRAALDLARNMGLDGSLELPIATQVEAVLHGGRTPRDAVDALLGRAMRDE